MQWYGDTTNGQDYTLFSYGKNGTENTPWANGQTTSFDSDIVFTDGQFYQWPEGMQTQ